MAVLIAKECFVPLFQKFLKALCEGFPKETKHCQTVLRTQVEKLIKWEPRVSADQKSWITNEQGQVLEFRTIDAPDEQLLYFMKYMCDQFHPHEEELLQPDINLAFFKHPENILIKHMNLSSVWKVATVAQRQWIWEQLNMLYLVAVALKKLPQEVFVHFHKLLDSTTQGLLAGQEHKINIKALRDQAMEILKDVGEEKFTALMRYFFMLLQTPYSPIPELVPQNYRSHARKFLSLLRSPKGIRLIRRGMTPFLRLAKDEWKVPINIPKEKELVGKDGKMDEKKMTSAFKNIVENFLNQDESVFQKILENKDSMVDKVKGTWSSLLVRKEKKKILPDDDSDDEEWIGIKKDSKIDQKETSEAGEDEEEDDDEESDIASDLLELFSFGDDESQSKMPTAEEGVRLSSITKTSK